MVIVAAVDKTERAKNVIKESYNLAEKFGDPVHVVHVMKRSEVIQAEETASNDEQISIDELRKSATDVASDILQRYPHGSEPHAVGIIGDPASELVKYASDKDARYIVVSPQRKSQTGKILFGSVAQSVLLNAPCPVVSLIGN